MIWIVSIHEGLEAWLPCQLVPRSIFHPSAKSPYELWRQNKIRSFIIEVIKKKKWRKRCGFLEAWHTGIWMYTQDFPAWVKPAVCIESRLGVNCRSAVNWNNLCRWLFPLSTVMFFFFVFFRWHIFIFPCRKPVRKKTNCLHAYRASSLHITVSQKTEKTNKKKQPHNKTTPDV